MSKNYPARVYKRDKRLVTFKRRKITEAIFKALAAVSHKDGELANKLSLMVVDVLSKQFLPSKPLSVESIQDVVEKVLIENRYTRAAKAYILYRQKRGELREVKDFLGVADDLKLGVNAIKVLEKRYLLKNEEGKVIEAPTMMFRRVARKIAEADRLYDKKADVRSLEEKFFEVMSNLEFLPNSPTLMNANTSLGQLSACFVLPVGDSVEEIFDSVKNMALIHQSGGGTGFSFSHLRPKGDVVKTTKGIASGPVSFMRVFDVATEVIKQGGRRRGANMGALKVNHPDIVEFITAKGQEGRLTNFNLSVAVDTEFMNKLARGNSYKLINPRNQEVAKEVSSRDVFNLIVDSAWRSGDPGIIFLDRINKANPTPAAGDIESTNPCGEAPLLAYESCNLGSINLVKMIKDREIDWLRLEETIKLAVHFLDNVIDVNNYPLEEIARATHANRKIGLGVMGWAEMLIKLSIPYDSTKALELAEKLARFITQKARQTSVELGKKRGSFANFKKSIWKKKGYSHLRNATVATIAPTGTISIIADVTSGIEPLFAIAFVRNVMEGTRLLEVNSLFEAQAKKAGFYSKKLMTQIAETGSIREIEEIPQKVRNIFKTALDIKPGWHVKMQAAWQKHVDNAVAKTVNLAAEATLEDIRQVFLLAYKLGCKGITVYRYGSRREQVLSLGSTLSRAGVKEKYTSAQAEYAGGCPAIHCPF